MFVGFTRNFPKTFNSLNTIGVYVRLMFTSGERKQYLCLCYFQSLFHAKKRRLMALQGNTYFEFRPHLSTYITGRTAGRGGTSLGTRPSHTEEEEEEEEEGLVNLWATVKAGTQERGTEHGTERGTEVRCKVRQK